MVEPYTIQEKDCLKIDGFCYVIGENSKKIYDELFKKGYADLTQYKHYDMIGC